MSNRKSECWEIEVRWENARESVTEASYIAVDQLGGSIEDAKLRAQEYIDSRVSRAYQRLEWSVGSAHGRIAYYGRTAVATFRITG